MEKIVIRLRKCNPNSSDFIESQTMSKDIEFLRDCFEISYKRAQSLLSIMEIGRDCCTTNEVIINLSYRQLARYVAKRQVNGLNKYWKYPHVLEFEEHEEDCKEVPIEIREGIRRC